METFVYKYFTPADEYPESSTIVKFGRGYSFASKPKGPDQLTFHLEMQGFAWWANQFGDINRGVFPEVNAGHIQDFYERLRMFEPFAFNHPTRGILTVRFAKPLPPFKPRKNEVIERPDYGMRGHAIETFQVALISLP